MSQDGETFFTIVGCMDGRVQGASLEFGQHTFHTTYADTITEAGIVGQIAKGADQKFLSNLKTKLLISIEKHHSNGVVVNGHAECAGNPVSDVQHKEDIKKSVEIIEELIGNKVPVDGVYVVRNGENWEAKSI